MTVPQLVIFDCDGVLVDSERLAVRVDQQVLAAMGWELTIAEVIDRFVGRNHAHMTAELSRHLGRQLNGDWDAPYAHLYQATFEAELLPVEGVIDMLDRLQLPVCVASNGSHARMRSALSLTGLLHRFEDRLFSGDDVPHPKPAPDLFLHAAAHFGAATSRCVVVEDSPTGIAAGAAAGMRVIAYSGGRMHPANALT
ncbi:MAG: HAD family hydrolase, partial [Ilumatobacteraceae bacterium]